MLPFERPRRKQLHPLDRKIEDTHSLPRQTIGKCRVERAPPDLRALRVLGRPLPVSLNCGRPRRKTRAGRLGPKLTVSVRTTAEVSDLSPRATSVLWDPDKFLQAC